MNNGNGVIHALAVYIKPFALVNCYENLTATD